MDPNLALARFYERMAWGEKEEASLIALDLFDWLAKDGFAPNWHGKGREFAPTGVRRRGAQQ